MKDKLDQMLGFCGGKRESRKASCSVGYRVAALYELAALNFIRAKKSRARNAAQMPPERIARKEPREEKRKEQIESCAEEVRKEQTSRCRKKGRKKKAN